MTLTEFKAWLNGFCDALGNTPPNEHEWEMIREKINGIVPDKPQVVLQRDLPTMTPFINPALPIPAAPAMPPLSTPRIWCQNDTGAMGITNGYASGESQHGVN